MKDRGWRRDGRRLTCFISSYTHSWNIYISGTGEEMIHVTCDTWGQTVKLDWGSTGWKRTFATDEMLRTLATRLRIHWSCTHTDWSADEESSEYWRPPSSVRGHEVLWPRETPGSPSGLRTTTLQRFTVLNICSLTFSSRVDTNRGAEHCRRGLHQRHLKHREKIRANLPRPRKHLTRKT